MSVVLWRIAQETRDYRADDISGSGAAKAGGRWNSVGKAMVYTSRAVSLGYLESLAHLGNAVFGSFVPGGDWAALGAAAAQMPAQQAQATRNIQQSMQMAEEMMGIMPQLMRGQRFIELAQARSCAWLRESSPR